MSINPLKIIKQKKAERRRQERLEEQRRIMKDVFLDKYIVLNGPFTGMKYIKDSYGSTLLPKILGSYEEPIQGWIDELIEQKKYHTILDIGCAEGYYACGFAHSFPETTVQAYDISSEARKLTKHLADINNLKNIVIHGICSKNELNSNAKKGTLIFCDIEGGEKELLQPKDIPNLKYADLIIESHDCMIPFMTEELIERFKSTHNIKMVIDYPNRVNDYKLPAPANDKELKLIIDERRSKYMRFLYLKSKLNQSTEV